MEDFEESPPTPPNIKIAATAANAASTALLPEKSLGVYENALEKFMEWRKTNNIESFSEKVILAYLSELSTKFKSSTLWNYYSILKTTLSAKYNVNIGEYAKVRAFLKRKNEGYVPKKSRILEKEHILKFMKEAPDDKFLLTKVILLFGVAGGLRRHELYKIKTSDIEDLKTFLIVSVYDRKAKVSRMFIISEHLDVYHKYAALRPKHYVEKRFFINYQKGKCTRQVIGINKIGKIPSDVATYLNLPNPNEYTGHCLRRSSASLQVEAGGLLALNKHDRSKSSMVEEGCTDCTDDFNGILSNQDNHSHDTFASNSSSTDFVEEEENFIEDIPESGTDYPTDQINIKLEVPDTYVNENCSNTSWNTPEKIQEPMCSENDCREEASVLATYRKKELELMERDIEAREQLVQVVTQGFNTLFELLKR